MECPCCLCCFVYLYACVKEMSAEVGVVVVVFHRGLLNQRSISMSFLKHSVIAAFQI